MNTTTVITITLQYQSVTTPKCEDNSSITTPNTKSIFKRLFTRTLHPHQTHSQLTTLSVTLPQHEANKLITNLNKLLQP
jgi:hypothetical protein